MMTNLLAGHDEQFAYKRALSRLLEMTSEAYVIDTLWSPLPVRERQWENIGAATVPLHSVSDSALLRKSPSDTVVEGDDFAEEACYDGKVAPLSARPAPPKIRPEHFWGVRNDWGKRAGAWGRGTGHDIASKKT
jgi:peroxisome-assembly ATPase